MLQVHAARLLGNFRLDVAFEAPTGGIVALFGKSGAGKTSLVSMLAGLLKPTQGRITLDGMVLFDSAAGVDLPPERRRLGYVFQEGRLFPHLTVRGNLLYGFRRAPADERLIQLDKVVELLGIAPLLDRRPAGLSGGEKQRVAIGRALLANPRLLLMDEPLASLDASRKEEILPFIEQLRDELRLPIVYVSHDMSEIVRLADTLVLMSEGRVAAVGPVDEVFGRLDLRPLTGRYEAGAILQAEVAEHDAGHDRASGLTRLVLPGGSLWVAHLDLPPGTRLRLRIRARDVALALTPPTDTSILNVLAGRIVEVGKDEGPYVDVKLALDASGAAAIWARVTARSARTLDLRAGRDAYALIKTVAIDRHSLGRYGR
ncbi:molybdenum ABC transporter ATP-binding protein [Rhodospirillaceae bacterium SYSU D60014]|uniref:molybdenum ABC transporter ATP-binding protein n=1 Tax=Virgifigura deserti TaxID=2268457 RepID=UPI000E66A070